MFDEFKFLKINSIQPIQLKIVGGAFAPEIIGGARALFAPPEYAPDLIFFSFKIKIVGLIFATANFGLLLFNAYAKHAFPYKYE